MHILQDLKWWSSGWLDWNLVLNPDGGPNRLGLSCDAHIIADPELNRSGDAVIVQAFSGCGWCALSCQQASLLVPFFFFFFSPLSFLLFLSGHVRRFPPSALTGVLLLHGPLQPLRPSGVSPHRTEEHSEPHRIIRPRALGCYGAPGQLRAVWAPLRAAVGVRQSSVDVGLPWRVGDVAVCFLGPFGAHVLVLFVLCARCTNPTQTHNTRLQPMLAHTTTTRARAETRDKQRQYKINTETRERQESDKEGQTRDNMCSRRAANSAP